MRRARPPRSRRLGFSVVELGVALILMVALLSVLIPALASARGIARKEQCASNLTKIGVALGQYLDAHNNEFPAVPGQPAWHWGGLRYSPGTDEPFIDPARPLNRFISPYTVLGEATHIFCCPADRGITGETAHIGTGYRTACRAFGTSYRANAALFEVRLLQARDRPAVQSESTPIALDQMTAHAMNGQTGGTVAQPPQQWTRGTRLGDITIAPSRLLVMGDPVWYEVYEQTGRNAQWHTITSEDARRLYAGEADTVGIGNVLFLDGSVRFQGLWPKGHTGPIAVEPVRR